MLDADELAYIENLVDNYEKEYLLSIKGKVRDLFVQAIKLSVYQYYQPNTYDRMYRLLDGVNVKLIDNTLFVHLDLNEGLGYSSAVTGEEVSQYISDFLIEGHDSGIGEKRPGFNQYERYEPRKILETAQQLIQNEYPDLKVEIEKKQ